jgi:polar amino acid transport system substrate-binding protein
MYRGFGFFIKVCVACVFATGIARAELPPNYQVVLLTENFPPFNMSSDGKNFARDEGVQGLNTDILREVFKRAGIGYDLSLRFPWDRIYSSVLEKPSYGIYSTTQNESRKPLFKWVGPLSTTERVLVAAPNKRFDLVDLNDAKRYRIGAYKSSSSAAYLEKNGVPHEESLRDQENMHKLLDGTLDLWATNDPVFRYYAAQEGVQGLQVAKVIEASTQQYLALNLDTPDEVVHRLQAALDQLRADGTIDRLSQGYFAR